MYWSDEPPRRTLKPRPDTNATVDGKPKYICGLTETDFENHARMMMRRMDQQIWEALTSSRLSIFQSVQSWPGKNNATVGPSMSTIAGSMMTDLLIPAESGRI